MHTAVNAEVEVPEIADLPIDPAAAARLDALCTSKRQIHAQIVNLKRTEDSIQEEIVPLAEALALPARTLGAAWDLRRTAPRVSEKIDPAILRLRLIQLGLAGEAATALITACTIRKESPGGWAVYGRGEEGRDGE